MFFLSGPLFAVLCALARSDAWEAYHTSLALEPKLAMEEEQVPRMEAATSIDEELRALHFG